MNDNIKVLHESVVFDGFTITFKNELFTIGDLSSSDIGHVIREARQAREQAARDAEWKAEEKARLEAAKAAENRPALNRETRGKKPVKPTLEEYNGKGLVEERFVTSYTDELDDRGRRKQVTRRVWTAIRLVGVREGASYRSAPATVYIQRKGQGGDWGDTIQTNEFNRLFIADVEDVKAMEAARRLHEEATKAEKEFEKEHQYEVTTTDAYKRWNEEYDWETTITRKGEVVHTVSHKDKVPGMLITTVTEEDAEGNPVSTETVLLGVPGSDGKIVTATDKRDLNYALTLHEARLYGLVRADAGGYYSRGQFYTPEDLATVTALGAEVKRSSSAESAVCSPLRLLLSGAMAAYREALTEYDRALNEWKWAGRQ